MKLIEGLIVLNRYGEGLTLRLFHTKKWVVKTRHSMILSQDKAIARVADSLGKKFPEIPDLDKQPGAEEFVAQAPALVEMTTHVYELALDILNWIGRAKSFLLQVCEKFQSGLLLTKEPHLLIQFMTLISHYCRVLILLSEIPDRRMLIAVYFAGYKLTQNSSLSCGGDIDELLNKYSDPIKRIHEDFPPTLGQVLYSSLGGLQQCIHLLFSVPEFRRLATLSLTSDKGSISIPSLTGMSMELPLLFEMRDWVIFSSIVAPEAFKDEGGVPSQLLSLVLHNVWAIRLVRNEMFLIHSPLVSLFSKYKDETGNLCLKKYRKVFSSALTECASGQGSVKYQRQFQLFLIQELRNLLCILSDFPALFAPKFSVVLGALSLAKNLVLMHYEHIHFPPPSHKLKKGEGSSQILEIIHLVRQLAELIGDHRQDIQNYYAEYLKGHHCRTLNAHLDSLRPHISSQQKKAFESAIEILKSIVGSGEEEYTRVNFQALRLNLMRLEVALSSSGTASYANGVLERIRWIVLHSRYLDEWQQTLNEASSFELLWSYSTQLSSDFEQTLSHPRLSEFAMSIFTVLHHFPRIATGHFPQEKGTIAKYCVEFAEQRCDEIAYATYRLLHDVWEAFNGWNLQLDPSNIALSALSSLPNSKLDRKPIPVAWESDFKNYGGLRLIDAKQRALIHLLHAYQKKTSYLVHDFVFSPIEYFRAILKKEWKDLFVKLATGGRNPGSSNIVPVQISQVERAYISLNYTISCIESFVDLSLQNLFRSIWKEAIAVQYVESTDPQNPFGWLSKDRLTFPDSSLIKIYANFYVELVTTQSQLMCYSPIYNSFVTRPGALPPIENFTSTEELRSLTRLIGPLGLRCIYHNLLAEAAVKLNEIIDFCEANAPTLEKLKDEMKRLRNQKDYDALIKSLKGMESFLQSCLSVSVILQLRKLFVNAQKQVVESTVPHLSHTVASASKQYHLNLLLETSLLSVDSLTLDCGLLGESGEADQALVYLTKMVVPTSKCHLLHLIPVSFATLFHLKIWGESLFVPHLGGYSNNLHVMAFGMSQAIITLSAALSTSPEEVMQIPHLLEAYLENAAMVLLLIFTDEPKQHSLFSLMGESSTRTSLPHMVVFLESFLKSTCYLSEEVLERHIPHTLIRSMQQSLTQKK